LAAVKTLVGWLALLFHVVFSLLLVALGALALATGPQALHLDMLPWSGAALAYILLLGGLFGLLSVVLAILDKLRFLFLIWSLTVAVSLFKSLIFSGYRFPPGQFRSAVYLISATWFAVLGACMLMLAKPAPGPRKYRVK
jgi:hypothetical protein